MTDSEFQDKINEMLDEFSPEKLKLHFIKAEEAYKKGRMRLDLIILLILPYILSVRAY